MFDLLLSEIEKTGKENVKGASAGNLNEQYSNFLKDFAKYAKQSNIKEESEKKNIDEFELKQNLNF